MLSSQPKKFLTPTFYHFSRRFRPPRARKTKKKNQVGLSGGWMDGWRHDNSRTKASIVFWFSLLRTTFVQGRTLLILSRIGPGLPVPAIQNPGLNRVCTEESFFLYNFLQLFYTRIVSLCTRYDSGKFKLNRPNPSDTPHTTILRKS